MNKEAKMDVTKKKNIEDLDFSKIINLPDCTERRALVASWLGQRNFC